MKVLCYLKGILLCMALLMVVANVSIIAYQSYRVSKINQQQAFLTNAIIKPVKFFQIGFSKCGTKTLADFFNANAVPSLHHDGGRLAVAMLNNYENGQPLLKDLYHGFYGFFDMERMYDEPLISIPVQLFREIDQQYPGSKFILNIRNKQDWLQSKAFHPAYHQGMRWLELHAKFYNITTQQVLEKWSKEWDDHLYAVAEYFKHRPNDLLVFNIDKDKPEKLCAFFADNFRLNPKLYKHTNKSIDRERAKAVNY